MKLVFGKPARAPWPLMFDEGDTVTVDIGTTDEQVTATRISSRAVNIGFPDYSINLSATEIDELIVFLQQVQRTLVSEGRALELPELKYAD